MTGAAALYEGFSPLSAATWSRWDSGHYLSIAAKGYEFVSCRQIGYPSADDACGNTVWFPGYPWIIRLLTAFGAEPTAVGVLVSAFFFFGALFVLWNELLEEGRRPGSIGVLIAAALFCGTIYDHAVFPISLLTFLAWVGIRANGRAAVGAASFLGALSYSTGVLLGGALSLASLFVAPIKKAIVPGVLALAGFSAVIGVQWISTGVPDAFFRASHKYFSSDLRPMESLWNHWALIFEVDWKDSRFVISLQTWMTTFWVVGSAIACAVNRDRVTHEQFKALTVAAAYWLFPHLTSGNLSFYRSEALVLPVVLCLPLWPRVAQWLALAALLPLAFLMSRLFFLSVLV